jgi:ABC-2 type transport system ATP-binding protein
VLAFSELHKEFKLGIRLKRVHAVRGVSLDVKRGEIFGYLGPNGAGKTTTMKMAMGLIQATRGEIRLFGRPHTEHGLRQRVGFLPENPYFYGYLTPVELLDYYGRLFGMAKAHRRKRTEELLDLVGLTEARNRPLRGFSKGMVQRAGVAQALINDPDLLVLDEPLSGLDPIGRKEVRDIVLAARQAGKTVFFSSHILQDIEMICDRVGIIRDGRLHRVGPLSELLAAGTTLVDVVVAGVTADVLAALAAAGAEVTPLGTQATLRVEEARLSDVLKLVLDGDGQVSLVAPHRDSLEDLFMREAGGAA